MKPSSLSQQKQFLSTITRLSSFSKNSTAKLVLQIGIMIPSLFE